MQLIKIACLGTQQGTKGLSVDQRAIKDHQHNSIADRNQPQSVTIQVQQKSVSSSGTSPAWIFLLGSFLYSTQ